MLAKLSCDDAVAPDGPPSSGNDTPSHRVASHVDVTPTKRPLAERRTQSAWGKSERTLAADVSTAKRQRALPLDHFVAKTATKREVDSQLERWPDLSEGEQGADDEKILRRFDMDVKYGPSIGLSRMERWRRASRLGLEPPDDVLMVLSNAQAARPKTRATRQSVVSNRSIVERHLPPPLTASEH